ncbi:unnamed protein product [Strongylus vulgaris]|uniref:Uncharacterized protein n=1 Tax=Strongylus vulgaris TaxID=40348 RepID=A0A3P7IUX3_STRVU|nr:unnamed protein product [Strongylus vulgaris]
MESVDKTLSSTQHLLEAIEQDDALLDDEYFMRKLEYLRMKHKETSDFLARILQQEECLPPSTSTCTCGGGHFALPSEWSFCGSVSAKIVTKNGTERAHSTKSLTRKKQQAMARAALEAYSSMEKKVEEKRLILGPHNQLRLKERTCIVTINITSCTPDFILANLEFSSYDHCVCP